jgi:predicted ATP-binding protein involved in virulence
MKIQKLTLTHYRGADVLPLDLHQQLNVLVGVNGAGKSTILDAITIMLSWVVNRIQRSNTSGRPISEEDIKNDKSFAAIDLLCFDSERQIEWRLAKTRKGHTSPEESSNLSQLSEYTKKIQAQITDSKEEVNLPLFVYYPVNRAVLDIPLRIRAKHRFELLTAYDDALTSGANFRTFFEWFREREDLENESRKYQNSLFESVNYQFPDPQLETVRSTINQFLPGFSNLTVRRSPLRMEVDKNGYRLTVNQLSDGEKCLIAMIADLARRLAIANPMRNNPLQGEAIVLIDEVDLHLHPKWQRMIVPRLLTVFPNCQFIISTHSPHVITHVKPENLFLLKQTDDGIISEKPAESYGKNVERVLEDLMGLDTTRPDEISEDLHTVYELIDGNHLEEARQKINWMRAIIGSDPELVKAEVLIKRKELIGK